MAMEDSRTPGTGSDNPAVAGSSGKISEAALAHAPALTERSVREHGISLQQAIEQVLVAVSTIKTTLFPALINYRFCEKERSGRNVFLARDLLRENLGESERKFCVLFNVTCVTEKKNRITLC